MKQNAIQPLLLLRGISYLLSLTLLVFLRRQLGERLDVDLCIACGLSWCWYWLHAMLARHVLGEPAQDVLAFPFLCALSLFVAYHLFSMWRRQKKPATMHSYGTGRPFRCWQYLGCTDFTIQRYVQPSVCFLVALGIYRIGSAVACWLAAASIAVFFEEQLARFQIRRRVLDVIDGRIDSQLLHGRVEERLSPAASKNAQAPVIEVAEASRTRTGKFSDMTARLDPELRGMIDPSGKSEGKESP